MDKKFIARQLFSAIREGNLKKVKHLINEDNDLVEMETPLGSWLQVAAGAGKLDIIKFLVSQGADVNKFGGVSNDGALNIAASDGYVDICEYLLEKGAILDTEEPERNPLFSAIHGGHTEIAKLLIDAGIDTKVKYTGENMKNMDALAYAREWGRNEIIELLQQGS